MRIISANKFHYLKGGAERYAFELAALLEERGHQVVPFAMRSACNLPTPWDSYFVSEVQTERVSFGWQGLRTAVRMLGSHEARRKFGMLVDAIHPDVVHVHNIYHQIGPGILRVARARGVPVVMTVHDYALISPNYSLYHHGRIQEPPMPGDFRGMIRRREIKDSFVATALAVASAKLHRALGSYDVVDTFIAPSAFVRAMLVRYGFPEEHVVHVPHPVDVRQWDATDAAVGRYALYVGRLVAEKGVATLIRAAAKVPGMPVVIVGTGPDEARLRVLARELGAENVRFEGYRAGADLRALVAGARFVTVPSEWSEPFGLVVLEAYASAKPVVASQIGGLAELVREGETGALTSAGDADDLADRMSELWADPERCGIMGRAGRAWVEQDFSPELHVERILETYREAARREQ